MRRTIPTLTTIVLAGCLPALAQAPRPAAPAQNRSAVKADGQAHRDDLRDVATLTALAKRHDAARSAKDKKALSLVRVDIRSAAMKELEESQIGAVSTAGTIVRNAAAVSMTPKRIQTAGVSSPAPDEPSAPSSEKAERRDDPSRAETRDRVQTRRLEIANDFRNMPVATSDAQSLHERALLSELIALAKVDAAGQTPETPAKK